MKKSALLVIFLTVFIDLIGFAIVLPLLPVYSADFNASYLMIGVIFSAYSFMQFLFAPAWGRLSDRIGRRPVILISLFGATGAYALFAVASYYPGQTGLYVLLASRIFAGICGANLSVASAYIADISTKQERSKRMGLIGIAFGLGFIVGPALGGISADVFGPVGPGWTASAICGANLILAFFVLEESRRPESRSAEQRPRWEQVMRTLRHPQIGFLIGIFFLATFCFTSFEVTFSLVAQKDLQYSKSTIAYLFAFCGLLSAFVQGGFIGRLVKLFGEGRLIGVSLVVLAGGLFMIPNQTGMGGVMIALGLFATGSALNRPPTFGLISANSSEDEQGATMGVTHSVGSLARIIGPICALLLFKVDHKLPYLVCAGVALVAALLAFAILHGKTAVNAGKDEAKPEADGADEESSRAAAKV